jgi:hypothetical protein
MADKKISALTNASTPLAGTEVLPIVQSGSTVKVAVSDLTAGRGISATQLTLSTGNLAIGTSGKGVTTGSAIPLGFGTNNATSAVTLDTSGRLLIGSTSSFSAAAKLQVQDNIGFETNGSGGKFEFFRYGVQTGIFDTPATSGQLNISGVSILSFRTSATERVNISAAGNVTLSTGNLVIGTAGKGIDFSATSGTGTSELLADYEEGTWTPTDGSGAGLSFTVTSATYTKVGNFVFLSGDITYPTTVSASAAVISGLPFNSISNGGGMTVNFTGYTSRYAGVTGGASITLYGLAGGGSGAMTNAALSTIRTIFTVAYRV